MPVATSPRTRVITLLAGVLLGALGIFMFPGSASAHAALVSTNPVAGSIIPTAPSQVVITFDEHVTPVQSKIMVVGPDEKKIDTGIAISVGDQLRIPVNPHVPNGTYLVSYRVISADTHPVAFGFYYSVGAPSAGGVPKPLTGDATDPVVAAAVSVFQFVGFGGLCLVVGPTLVLIALWPRRLSRTVPSRIVYGGLGAVALSAVVGVYLQAPYGQGTSLFGVTGSDVSNVLNTTLGRAFMVRLAAVVLAAFLLGPVLAGRGRRSDHILLAGTGLVATATWAFAGHPVASSVPPLTIVADTAHLGAAAIWVGGLMMLAALLLRKANERELNAILPVWSNWAMLSIAVLVLGGATQALIEIGSVSALLHTTYGQLVLVKIGILLVILLVAQGARKMVQRHAGLDLDALATDVAAREPATAAALARSDVESVRIGSGRAGTSGTEQPGVELPGVELPGVELPGVEWPGAELPGDPQSGGPEPGSRGFDDSDGSDDADDESDWDDHEWDDHEWDDEDWDDDGNQPDLGTDGGADGAEDDDEPPGMVRSRVKRLRRSVLVELTLAIAVLVATSILVQSSPVQNAGGVTTNAQGTVSLTSPLYTLQVDFLPSGSGTDLHIYVYNAAGGPQAAQAISIVATTDADGGLTQDLGVAKITDSHWTSTAILPPGKWTFTFTVRTTAIDEASVSTTQNIGN